MNVAKSNITSDIDSSFDHKTKITHCKWTILQNYVPQFKRLPNGNYTKSHYFTSEKELKWSLYCYPNGKYDKNSDSCKLYLKLSSLPNQYETITFYYYLYCKQTYSYFEEIQVFNKSGQRQSWPDRVQLSSELIPYNNVLFLCGIRILRIADKSNNIQYQYPLHLKDIFNKTQIRWHLNHKIITHCKKNIYWGKLIGSGLLSNIFSIGYYPNGGKAECEGNISLNLNVLSFPIGIESMKIKYIMKCPQLNRICSNSHIFSYKHCSGIIPKFCLSNKLMAHSSLDFMVHIEILQCYDKNGRMIRNILSPSVNVLNQNNGKMKNKLNNLLQKYSIHHALVLLICIKDYETMTQMNNLNGTKIDRDLMMNLFRNDYQYEVIRNHEYIVTMDDFDKFINYARNKLYRYHASYDAFIFGFAGHGDKESIILSDGSSFGRMNLYKFFNGLSCKPFNNKPKLFVIDACKGHEVAPQIKARGSSSTMNVNRYPSHPDDNIIVFNSNSDEYVSWDTQSGGVLIQSFNNVLQNNQNEICLDDMSKCIEMEMKRICNNIGIMQTLEKIERGIKKKIYFCRSKK